MYTCMCTYADELTKASTRRAKYEASRGNPSQPDTLLEVRKVGTQDYNQHLMHDAHSARSPLLPCGRSHPAPPHHLLHALHLSSPACLLPGCMCVQVCENGCTHVCTCVHVCASMSVCISWCLAMCACMCECTCVCGFVCSTGQPTSVAEDVYIRICPRISLYLCLSFAGLLPI